MPGGEKAGISIPFSAGAEIRMYASSRGLLGVCPTFQETPAEFGMLTSMAKYRAGAEGMVMRSHVSRLPFANGRGRFRPGTLPTAPNRDVVKPEFVPPPIKHRLIETQDSVLGDARRRR